MKKIFKSKKAYFSLLIAFMTFIVLAYVFIRLDGRYEEFDIEISEKQIELIKTYQEGEKLLAGVDSTSRLSLQNSISQLALKGGFIEGSECGSHFGYNLWQGYATRKREGITTRDFVRCYPDMNDLESGLTYFMNGNMNNYMRFYGERSRLDIPQNNYDLYISLDNQKTTVHGIALQPINQPLECDPSWVKYAGNAAFDQSPETGKCGIYSPNPSFTQQINYDLEEYSRLIEIIESGDLQNLVSRCDGDEACLSGIIDELDTFDFDWSMNCESAPERAFYTFVSAYQQCTDSGADNCRCSGFDFATLEAIRIGLGDNYKINLNQNSDSTVTATLTRLDSDEVLVEELLMSSELCIFEDVYGSSLGSSLNIEDVINRDVDSLQFFSSMLLNNLKFDLNGEYKFHSNVNHLFLPFLWNDPDMCVVPSSRLEIQDYVSLPYCGGAPQDETAFRFCVESSKEVITYDRVSKEVRHKPVKYKFALRFRDLEAPPKISGLKVEDKQKAENSFVLTWKKVKESSGIEVDDLDYYKVYCRTTPFVPFRGEYSLKGLNPTVLLYSDSDEISIGIDKCDKTEIADGTNYYFAVTAQDTSANEGEAVVVGPVSSVDDLAPGKITISINNAQHTSQGSFKFTSSLSPSANIVWQKPTKNEDGFTDLDDFSQYYVYISETEMTALPECITTNNCLKWTTNQITFNLGEKKGSIQITDGKTYFFAVVAVDTSNNFINDISQDFTIPMQWNNIQNALKGYLSGNKIIWGTV